MPILQIRMIILIVHRHAWFWGEYGYVRIVRVKFGALGLSDCDWATVADYTAPEKHNYFACHEGGDNCKARDFTSMFEGWTMKVGGQLKTN